jgi:hypothetical protein
MSPKKNYPVYTPIYHGSWFSLLLRKIYWSCRFIYTFLGMGILLCLLTCSGHIAAETANGHYLSCVSLIARCMKITCFLCTSFHHFVFYLLATNSELLDTGITCLSDTPTSMTCVLLADYLQWISLAALLAHRGFQSFMISPWSIRQVWWIQGICDIKF